MRFTYKNLAALAFILALLPAFSTPALAGQKSSPALHLILKEHKFTPRQITIPTGKKVKLIIKNENGQAAEFRSFDMHAHTNIPEGEEGTVFVGPLKAGSYSYYDSLDAERASGTVNVR